MQDIKTTSTYMRWLATILLFTVYDKQLHAQDGTFDISFGTNGLVTMDIDIEGEVCGDAICDTLGRIIMVGSAYNGTYRKAMVMRLTQEGIADETFNYSGYQMYGNDGPANETHLNAVDIQADGKIVAGGYGTYPDSTYAVLYRIKDDGSFDTTFGDKGIAKMFYGHYWNDAAITDLIVQPDGKILFCGLENSENTGYIDQFVTGRCLSDGSLDMTFGGTGIIYCYFDGSSSNATSMLLQPDGKIIVGGRTNGKFALIRYLSNGVPDNTFGSWGEVTTSVTNDGFLTDIGILSDGKIMATGYLEMDNPGGCEYGKTRIAVACYNSDGSLNLDFNGDGMTTFNFDACNDESYTLLVQPDDKIIIGGSSGNSSILESFDYFFLRLLPNGSRDPLFGTNGLLESDMYETYEFYSYPRALIFQPSGKVILVGYTNDWDVGNTFFSAMRINTGVDPTDLEQMNWNNEVQSDSSFATWFNDNLLYVSNAKGEEIQMYIYTVSGSLIYSFKAPTGLSKYTLKHLPKGMYCVVSDDRRALQTLKIIISYSGY